MKQHKEPRPDTDRPELIDVGSDGCIRVDYSEIITWENHDMNCSRVIEDLGYYEPINKAHMVLILNTKSLKDLVTECSVSVLCSEVDLNVDLFLVEVER